MKNLSAIILLFLSLTSIVHAEDQKNTTNESEITIPVVTPIKEGSNAPYDGVLLSPEAVATIIAEKEELPKKIDLEVKKAVAESNATCDADKKQIEASFRSDKQIMQARLDAALKEKKILVDDIKKSERRSKLQKIWIVVSAAVGAVGVGVVGGVVAATK